ncbi:MAG: amidohydrolase family protein [Sphingomonas sp.]|uniref:amidohydrolase family protein n=1 Tax=Sphingomonas sp. TaxID=28214 RepID=UPI0035688F27
MARPLLRLLAASCALGAMAGSAAAQVADHGAPWLENPFPSTYVPLPRSDVMLRHATILDGAGNRIDDGDVLVRSGKIAAVGRALANPGGAREIDARGRWITPGVIDVHSHDGTYVLPLTTIDREAGDVSEGSDVNVADTWIETAVNPQDTAFSRALRNGVTTIQILPGSSPIFSGRAVTVKPIRATSVAAMKFPGAPYGFKMACGENPKENGAETHRGPTSRQGVVTYVRKAFMDAQQILRDQKGEDGKPGPRRGPPAGRGPDLKREALAGIMAGDLRLNMHCYRADDMATMLSVAKEFGFHITAFHHATEAYKMPAALREAGTCAAVWGDWWGYKMEALDAVRANAPMLDRAGVCVTMHSDSPGSGQRLTIEAAKAAGAGRRMGIVVPPERMIRWVTSNSAKVLGLEDRIGTLAPGYNADLVVWSGDPFSVYTKADLVFIDGAIAADRSAPPASPASDFELGRVAAVRP